jgi:GNAT superfamily N-acetyltransferase
MDRVPLEDVEASGIVARVAPGRDERLWLDCELASLAEHRLGDATDPRALTDDRRDDWLARATLEAPWPLARREAHERAWWLVEDGARVGTLALSRALFGVVEARVSSFYVFPALRGAGVGARALARLGATLAARGLGYRLDTCWAWQRTVRFYLRQGLWLRMWKHDLTLAGGLGQPAHDIVVEPDAVTLFGVAGSERAMLARARTRGGRLALDGPSPAAFDETPFARVASHARTTLSLALALEGRCLVRSARHLVDARGSDCDAPEGIARRIEVWEAFDRAQGWRVETPRIPGLTYPTWESLEARWEAERLAWDAERKARTPGP